MSGGTSDIPYDLDCNGHMYESVKDLDKDGINSHNPPTMNGLKYFA